MPCYQCKWNRVRNECAKSGAKPDFYGVYPKNYRKCMFFASLTEKIGGKNGVLSL